MKEKTSVEYYEYKTFKLKKYGTVLEFFVAVIVLLILVLLLTAPFFLMKITIYILKLNGITGILPKVIVLGICLLLFLFNMFLIFQIADRKIPVVKIIGKIHNSYVTEKYPLNIPEAYKKVRIVPVTDGKVLDELYLNGAVEIRKNEIDDKYFSYVYNLINDNYDLKGEDLVIYKIAAEVFREHYPFYKTILNDELYVFPVSVFGMSTEEYKAKRAAADLDGKEFYVLDFWDFGDKVEGVSMYRRKSYFYKDEVAKFYEKI